MNITSTNCLSTIQFPTHRNCAALSMPPYIATEVGLYIPTNALNVFILLKKKLQNVQIC